MDYSSGEKTHKQRLTIAPSLLLTQIRLDIFHGELAMSVAVHDDGKKDELIGDGVLLLNEVIDKGELDGKHLLSLTFTLAPVLRNNGAKRTSAQSISISPLYPCSRSHNTTFKDDAPTWSGTQRTS